MFPLARWQKALLVAGACAVAGAIALPRLLVARADHRDAVQARLAQLVERSHDRLDECDDVLSSVFPSIRQMCGGLAGVMPSDVADRVPVLFQWAGIKFSLINCTGVRRRIAYSELLLSHYEPCAAAASDASGLELCLLVREYCDRGLPMSREALAVAVRCGCTPLHSSFADDGAQSPGPVDYFVVDRIELVGAVDVWTVTCSIFAPECAFVRQLVLSVRPKLGQAGRVTAGQLRDRFVPALVELGTAAVRHGVDGQ